MGRQVAELVKGLAADTQGVDALLAELGVVAHVTARCSYCPGWSWTGPVEEARRRFEAHREGERHARRAEAAKPVTRSGVSR